MLRTRSSLPIWMLALALALAAPLPALAQGAVGQVTSLSGDVQASGPGGTRSLACGDDVFAGDTITTGSAGSAGILMNDVLAALDGGSSLTVGRTEAGSPDAQLDEGRVRLIDARDGGVPARLGARDAQVRVAGNDAEAYVLSEKIGPYAMFCEWDAPLSVSRGGEVRNTDPNHCVIAKDSEPLYVSNAHDERMAPGGDDTCPPDLGGLAAADPHFRADDVDVALGPPGEAWSNMASGVGMPRRDPCDVPGAGCAIGSAVPTVIVEPPPGTGGQPGAGTFN
ncbi:MAG: hypothetical protein ACQGVC_16665 [Myxococcota bacterium]